MVRKEGKMKTNDPTQAFFANTEARIKAMVIEGFRRENEQTASGDFAYSEIGFGAKRYKRAVEVFTEQPQQESEQTSLSMNLWLHSVQKAFMEYIQDELVSHGASELRLNKKLEAAYELFSDELKVLRRINPSKTLF